MLATAIIMFREVLEAALIIAIVLGASRGIVGRGRWVATGIGLGLVGASIVAILAAEISSAFSGNGQAILDAGILLSAVAMLTWHNVWMSAHGRQLAAELSAVGADVQTGKRPLAALLVITLVAVMREGSEAVLFLWAIAAGGGHNSNMVMGGVGGVAAGVLVGFLLYRGLLRIPVRHFFSITSWLILLLAAGLAAQAAGFLNQAGLLPALGNTVWNTSHILSQSSLFGQFLHILVGYVARPSGIQLVFYVGTLMTILLLMRSKGGVRMARVGADEGTAKNL
ncbi:MAG: FTR1 family protein [Pseudomonadota bacterium]